MSCAGRRPVIHRSVRGPRLRPVRALRCRRRVRHVPLPDAARERAGLFLLARSRDRRADAPIRMVRDEVADCPDRVHVGQVPDLVRAAAILRSDARALAQGASVFRRARHGWRSSTRSSTSSITSIRKRPASAASCVPTARDSMRSHGPQFYEQVAEMVKRYLATRPDPALFDFLQARFRRAERAATAASSPRRSGISRRFRSATWSALEMPPADCSVRVEPLKPLTQPVDLHRSRPAHPAVHRIAHESLAAQRRDAA